MGNAQARGSGELMNINPFHYGYSLRNQEFHDEPVTANIHPMSGPLKIVDCRFEQSPLRLRAVGSDTGQFLFVGQSPTLVYGCLFNVAKGVAVVW